MRYLIVLTTDAAPPPAVVLERYTAGLVRAGVLLVGEQLADDCLVLELADGRCRVVEPPDAASRAAAVWIVETADRPEAVEWARRLPVDRGRVEVRRIVRGAAAGT